MLFGTKLPQILIVWTEPLPMLCMRRSPSMEWGYDVVHVSPIAECKIQIIVKLFMTTMPLY